MDEIVSALRDQLDELSSLLAGRDEADFALPTPGCPGGRSPTSCSTSPRRTSSRSRAPRVGSPKGGSTSRGPTAPVEAVDDTAALMVERERGEPGVAAVRDRWQASADQLVAVLDATDPHERVRWVAGMLSARTLATTRASPRPGSTPATSRRRSVSSRAPTDRLRLIARLAWRTIPYAFDRAGRELHGPVAFELQSPSGEPWSFVPDDEPVTIIRGDALPLCRVVAQRLDPADSGLRGEGPDADAVLELVRTYA